LALYQLFLAIGKITRGLAV